MGLNCVGPLMQEVFPRVSTTELHEPKLVESVDGELWLWMSHILKGRLDHAWTPPAWGVDTMNAALLRDGLYL